MANFVSCFSTVTSCPTYNITLHATDDKITLRSVDDDTGSSNNDPAVPVCHATEECTASPSVTLPCEPLMLTSVSHLTSVNSDTTEPGPQRPIPLMTTPPTILCPIPSSTEPSPINCTHDVSTLLAKFFLNLIISKVHHHDMCQEKTHCNLLGYKFTHEWLYLKVNSGGKSKNNNSALDVNAGLWWLIYIEDKGMFCLLCMKHMQGEA